MNKKVDVKIIIKYVLFTILIIETLFIIYYSSKTTEEIDGLEEKIKIMEKANLDLTNENRHLTNENERIGMMNTEIWELFLADHSIKED